MTELNILCENLTKERTSSWFSEFLNSTNEKKIISKFLQSFVDKLTTTSSLAKEVKILDIGSGEGEIALSLIDHLKDYRKNISYQAIDSDDNFNKQTKDKLITKTENLNIVTGNCFGSDINQLDNDADILIASNIAYYASDIDAFTNSLNCKLQKNGIAIYMHDSRDSEMNSIRDKYAIKVQTDTVGEIAKSLKKAENLCFLIKINCSLNLPGNFREYIDYLRQNGTEYTPEYFYNSKMLLEFIAQTPLEIIERKDRLDEYIDDLINLDAQHKNKIVITSDIQIVPSIKSSKEFLHEILPSIINELKEEYQNSSIVSDVVILDQKLISNERCLLI